MCPVSGVYVKFKCMSMLKGWEAHTEVCVGPVIRCTPTAYFELPELGWGSLPTLFLADSWRNRELAADHLRGELQPSFSGY